ncbi:hypothetical protein CP532_6570 [Ophiocordyceps camponoti-leonardi (nom. inval.)]|nr:hypothetical protein CP532_6570 [Ophiocordyceps camponoti-leonardi (nom. inval.)]
MESINVTESTEQMQARHRRELKELQGRITNKKKNATKKTRKGVNAECDELERRLREKHAIELRGKLEDEPREENEADDREEEEEVVNDKEPEPRKTSDEEKTSTSDQETPTESTTTAPKKRNRQRERLARRAAERTAEAQRAGDEAASMTDHRARESQEMKEAMEEHGLVEHEIAPDGHCLFSAVADQLEQNAIPILDRSSSSRTSEPVHRLVRRAAVSYMVENADDFVPFLDEDFDAYAARMRDTAEWGGQLELTALARRYGAEIRVLDRGRVEVIGEEEGKAATGKTLWLAYYRHGYGLGEHYNSLRRKKTEAP